MNKNKLALLSISMFVTLGALTLYTVNRKNAVAENGDRTLKFNGISKTATSSNGTVFEWRSYKEGDADFVDTDGLATLYEDGTMYLVNSTPSGEYEKTTFMNITQIKVTYEGGAAGKGNSLECRFYEGTNFGLGGSPRGAVQFATRDEMGTSTAAVPENCRSGRYLGFASNYTGGTPFTIYSITITYTCE